MLERGGCLPVAELLVEALQRVGCVARRQSGPAEILIRPRAALAVGRRVQEVAVRRKVSAARIADAERRVIPRPVGRERKQIRGIRRRHADDVRVPADRPLQRGLAVAKEIVGAADTRAEIPPVRDVLRGRNPSLGDEEAGRRDKRRARHVDVVVAQPEVHRQAANPRARPLILHVDRGIERGLFEMRRRREQLQRHGALVIECIENRPVRHEQIGAVFFVVARRDLSHVHAALQVMRAGDVGDRELLVVLPARQRRVRRAARRRSVGRPVFQVERLFRDLDAVEVDPLAALVRLRDVIGAAGKGQENPVRHRIRPRRSEVVVRFIFVLSGRFRSDQRPALRPEQRVDAVAVVLKRSPDDDLVLLGGLQREPQAVVTVEVVAARGPAEVRLVQHALRLCELVPVDPGGILLRDALAGGAEEPQLVSFDRTADARRRLHELLDRRKACRGGVEAACEQLVVDVVALKAGSRVRDVRGAREDVAAVLRDHVQLHTARVAVRAYSARLGHHFLKGDAIEDENAGVCGRHLGVHAVDDGLRVRRSVNREPRLRPVAQRAGRAVTFVVQHRAGQDRD